MSKPNEHARACLGRLLTQLTGLTITGGAADDAGEFWGFAVKGKQCGKTVSKAVFVLCNPEGNGHGWGFRRDP